METIFFFYGLSFILMGAVIFFIPKREYFSAAAKDLWLLSLFGIIHGINEWVDLFILKGRPFDVTALKMAGSLLLPASFIFLLVFGAKIISRNNPRLSWLNFSWMASLSVWITACIFSRDLLFCGIFARYFIGLPGGILSSLAILQIFLKSDRAKLPKIVSISVVSVIAVFFAYSILAGFIVPEAKFFPAAVFNYVNFTRLFGWPVQFFRMLCAIALAAGFFVITGIFRYNAGKAVLIGGIRRKTLLFICSASIITAALIISIAYFWGYELLFKTIVKERQNTVQVLADSVGLMVDARIEQIETYFSRSIFWNQAFMESNAKYAAMAPKDALDYFIRMDEEWKRADKDSSLVREYTDNAAARRIRKVFFNVSDITEFILADKFGALVGASEKTTDFYQADEEWWRRSFNSGMGGIFIGGIGLDAQNYPISITFAVPIRGLDGEVIGACKVMIGLNNFLAVLSKEIVDMKEHLFLLDTERRVIFHAGNTQLCSDSDFKELLSPANKRKKFKAYDFSEKGAVVVACAGIRQENLVRSGLSLLVGVEADKRELLFPLHRLMTQAAGICAIMISLLIIIGLFISRLFTKPLLKLREAAKKFSAGDFNYLPEIKTGDEVEEIADVLKKMAVNLNNAMKVMRMDRERLAVYAHDLEKSNSYLAVKVNEAQKAEEDLAAVKKELEDKISKLEQFNKIAVDRELKMRELKEKISGLEEKLKIQR